MLDKASLLMVVTVACCYIREIQYSTVGQTPTLHRENIAASLAVLLFDTRVLARVQHEAEAAFTTRVVAANGPICDSVSLLASFIHHR
jgi:hypothetical protein